MDENNIYEKYKCEGHYMEPGRPWTEQSKSPCAMRCNKSLICYNMTSVKRAIAMEAWSRGYVFEEAEDLVISVSNLKLSAGEYSFWCNYWQQCVLQEAEGIPVKKSPDFSERELIFQIESTGKWVKTFVEVDGVSVEKIREAVSGSGYPKTNGVFLAKNIHGINLVGLDRGEDAEL